MTRGNSDLLVSLRADLMRQGMELPPGRFFTPRYRFWDVLKLLPPKMYVDCGAGNGQLVDEAVKLGYQMIGLDIAYREDQSSRVQLVDCTTFPFSPGLWPIICRPSHDGFCADTIAHALCRGANAIYVGLSQNIEQDLQETQRHVKEEYTEVGFDGEVLLILSTTGDTET